MSFKPIIEKLDHVICLLEILATTVSKEQNTYITTPQLNKVKLEEQYVTTREACTMLKCSSVTLWKIRKRGEIVTYGYGVNLRFKKLDILNFLMKR